MADTYRAVIPYESLDPLTIGASGDEYKVNRDTLELDIPQANLLAAIYPDEPAPVPDATEAARQALEQPVSGPRFSELLAGAARVAVIIDNQFRPTPQSKLLPAVFDALEAAGMTDAWSSARTARSSRCRSRTSSRRSAPTTSPAWSASASRSSRTSRATRTPTPTSACPRAGTPVWLLTEVARLRREDHDRPGAVEPLGRGRRRQADPPRRRLGRDDRVEPLRLRPFAADPLRRLRGPHALGHRRGRHDVRPHLHDERPPRHARPRDRLRLRLAPGSPPRGDPAVQPRSTRTTTPAPPTSRSAASSRPPTTCSSTPAGAACRPTSSSRRAGRSSTARPSPGVSTAIGDFPGLALMDLMKPYMPPTRENYQRVLKDIHARAIQMWAGCIWVPIYEVMTRKRLVMVTLEENLEMAADIGLEATTSLDEAFAQALERHGPDGEGRRPPVRPLPAPAQRDPHGRGGDPGAGGGAAVTAAPRVRSRLDDDRRAAAPLPRRRGGAAHVTARLAVRALRRRLPRAADDGGEAPPELAARRARGIPRARAPRRAQRRAGRGRGSQAGVRATAGERAGPRSPSRSGQSISSTTA